MAACMMQTVWQNQTYHNYLRAFKDGKLGHAQLLSGPAMLGKHDVVEILAKRFLCLQATNEDYACGMCQSCNRFEQGTHGDFKIITLTLNEKTGKLRTEISVDQIRELNEWLSLTSQFGKAQFAIIRNAHQLNRNAANALLKSLEEPNPNRFVFLVTEQAFKLPATIRSRCQRTEMALPEPEIAKQWLQTQGLTATEAGSLLSLASGNPGLAKAWHDLNGMKIYQDVREDLTACFKGQAGASELAKKWLLDEHSALRMNFATQIAYGLAKKWAFDAEQLQNSPKSMANLQEWIDAMNRLRLSLSQPLRHDLSLAGLFYDWHQLFVGPR
jgi:DNA polymerase-3 subunit delta'